MEPYHVADNYDWGKSLVVALSSILGATGAIALAQRFPTLNVLVQDLDNVVDGAEGFIPDDITGRVKFIAHDFFTEQKVQAQV